MSKPSKIRFEKTWRPTTAKQAKIVEVLKKHPEWSDRQIADEVGASHPTVASVRNSWGIYCQNREGADGIVRRAKLPHKVDVKRFKYEVSRAAREFQYVLQGIANAFAYEGKPDPKFKAYMFMLRMAVVADLANVMEAIPGETDDTAIMREVIQIGASGQGKGESPTD